MTPLGAVVLCGGMSRRMGRPKAWLPFGDEVLLQRVVRVLGEVASPIVVVAAPGQDLPELPPAAPIVRDPVEGRGPLQGIAVGLAALDGRAEHAFVSSTDVPFLNAAFVRRMHALAIDHDIAIIQDGGHHHPLGAVYRTTLHHEAEALLAAGRMRPFFLLEKARTRLVTREDLVDVDPDLDALRNVNTPEDYLAALAKR